ncbi:MAG TPA: hypothetical protein VFB46_12110 [Gemmatimonadaceae bacterium]|nr:hypothetical protein [Gemmatimonadaceae bacterium]
MKRVLLLGLAVASPLAAQDPDPRPNECWGFIFGAWSPPLDWNGAGHGTHAAPPPPETATTGGAPRHDAASIERAGAPTVMLFPTWWPAGVGIRLDRQPSVGDTVKGIAYALIADGLRRAPESRILAWRTPCGEPPARAVSRAAPDERRSPRAAPASAPPPRRRDGRPH